MTELKASELRVEIARICEQFQKHPLKSDVVKVTHYGKAAIAMIPWEMYTSILETLDILQDDELMIQLKSAMTEMKKGKGKSWDAFKKEQSLDV